MLVRDLPVPLSLLCCLLPCLLLHHLCLPLRLLYPALVVITPQRPGRNSGKIRHELIKGTSDSHSNSQSGLTTT